MRCSMSLLSRLCVKFLDFSSKSREFLRNGIFNSPVMSHFRPQMEKTPFSFHWRRRVLLRINVAYFHIENTGAKSESGRPWHLA